MANREDYQHYSTSYSSFTRSVTIASQKHHLNLVFQANIIEARAYIIALRKSGLINITQLSDETGLTKELPSERPIIDSTKAQRLSYYRSYATTKSKSNIVETQRVDVNSFLWLYSFTLFFKSLPHAFVHFFLAAYAPEEHNFITKMVPFSYGCKFLFVMVGMLELLACADMLVMISHYTMFGIIKKNPWNRCHKRHYFDIYLNETVSCYEIKEFTRLIRNTTNTFHDFTFLSPDNKHFTLAQIDYYRLFIYGAGNMLDISCFIVIWSLLVLIHHEVRKKTFWKILHAVHVSIMVMEVSGYMYLLFPFYGIDESVPIATIPMEDDEGMSILAADLEVFSESITAPPIVHILTARSTQTINPSTDSSEMILSNALTYIFKEMLNNKLRQFSEAILRTEIPVTSFNQQFQFCFWPIFFQTFYLGDIYSILYITTTFVSEILCLLVTLNCLMEMTLFEWPILKRWMAMMAVEVIGITVFFTLNVDTRMVLWIYGKGIATLADIICIYIMYPIGRLVDDYTFYYGVAPTRLRILSLRLVPAYYIFKLYITLNSLWYIMRTTEVGTLFCPHYMWSWTVMVIPILLGMLYIVYLYLVKFRMTWTYIFRPTPRWGPRDFSVRQLRKQFDSRFYIASEAPKLLSRYLMAKRESKVYKIDVRYDLQRRSTVSKAVGFGKTEEKKIKQM